MIMVGRKANSLIYASAISANMLSFCAGSAFSWSSPVLTKLASTDPNINPLGSPITPFQESWITSMICLGSTTGTAASTFIFNKIGRKRTLMLYGLTVLVSHLIYMFGSTSVSYIIGRFIIGIGIGATYSCIPGYLGEISEDSNRGFIGCLMGIFVSLGTCFSYIVGPFVSIRVFSLLNLIPLLIFYFTFVIFVPESPYYYIAQKDQDSAEQTLRRFRAGEEIEKEMTAMLGHINESHTYTWKDMIGSKLLRKSLFIMLGMIFFQQLSGIFAITAYTESIFLASRTSIPSHVSAILVGLIQLISNGFTSIIVDRVGRKLLLIVSCIGNCLSTGCLGTYFYLKANNFQITGWDWLPTASLIVFMISFNFGIGILTWVYMGEIYPSKYQAIASSITVLFCSLMTFTVALIFPYFSIAFGMAGTFWIFSGCCATSIVFVITQVPETRGKSLQDIQNMLLKRG